MVWKYWIGMIFIVDVSYFGLNLDVIYFVEDGSLDGWFR